MRIASLGPSGPTKRVKRCANMGRRRHAYGATERVRGVPTWGGAAMRSVLLGPSVEFHLGPPSA
eukprot:7345663-Pyramimonas_sp.AAC.1